MINMAISRVAYSSLQKIECEYGSRWVCMRVTMKGRLYLVVAADKVERICDR